MSARGPRGRLPRNVAGSFLITMLVLTAMFAVVFYDLKQNRDLAKKGREAHVALCVLKADYKQRLKDGEKFLREHPNGIPGIKVNVIRSSVFNIHRTLHALRILHCE